ncbi:unnamed protein product [Haemonchus placei]|uniref:tRNA_int_end_N2 domain-containing protein n=1 Tax=Haemonchus placei TaxID=6290 RepID=A0A158QNJ3_HAEPC|nr:unnamed protein product [Haemonchus placei]
MDKEEDAAVHSAKRHCGHGGRNAAEAAPYESNTQDMCRLGSSAQKEKKCKQLSKESSELKPVSCKRSAKSLIYVAFNREHSIFEVTKKRKNYLKIMGVPLRSGGHVLFPEEVLYLMEHWMVYATDEGRPLTLYDGIRILGETGIPFHKYRAYSALRKAGFAVLRPNEKWTALPSMFTVLLERVTKNALTIQILVVQGYAMELTCPVGLSRMDSRQHLHWWIMRTGGQAARALRRKGNNPDSIYGNKEKRGPYTAFSETSAELKQALNPVTVTPLRGSRRMLRPAYWPDFQPITSSVSSWKEYSSKRRTSIKSAKSAARDRRNAYPQNARSEYDFEVFLADRFVHSVPESPAFRVTCFDSRRGALSCAYAHRFADDIPLILSIFDCGYICFIETSGKSIDLNRYLENLHKESQ